MGGVVAKAGNSVGQRQVAMTEPSLGYHGVKFYETFGDFDSR
jgi:hypothetical protein